MSATYYYEPDSLWSCTALHDITEEAMTIPSLTSSALPQYNQPISLQISGDGWENKIVCGGVSALEYIP